MALFPCLINLFPGFTVLAHSGMPESELHMYGRPYGGIGIVYRNNTYNSVKLINDYGISMNRRVQCISIEIFKSIYYYLMCTFPAKVIQIMLQK